MGGHVHVPHFIQLFYIFIGSLKQGTNRILKTHQKYISNTHPTLFNNQGHVRIITYSQFFTGTIEHFHIRKWQLLQNLY